MLPMQLLRKLWVTPMRYKVKNHYLLVSIAIFCGLFLTWMFDRLGWDVTVLILFSAATIVPTAITVASIFRALSIRSTKLRSAPGTKAIWILDFVFSKKAMDEVFRQCVVDMRDEYFTALDQGRRYKGRWIVVREHIRLLNVVAQYLCISFGKQIAVIWKTIK